MKIRHASEADKEAVRRLWERWQSESPTPPPWADVRWEANEAEIDRAIDANGLFLAEEDGEAFGFASSWLEGHVARIGDLYVSSSSRRAGAGRALVEAVIENLRARGATHLLLGANLDALGFYEQLGFREESRTLVLDLELREVGRGRSWGSIHVQTDDIGAVERAVRQFVPRLPGRSRGSIVAPPRSGWIAVYDDVCDRDPSMLRRLAAELSDRMGAVVLALGVEHEEVVRFVLLEAGRVVDEYLSVPEHYGHLPPGDVIALAANPRVVARLTGAEPAAVRAVARTANAPADLPPPAELLAGIAHAVGIEGAEHGWEDLAEIFGGSVIDRVIRASGPIDVHVITTGANDGDIVLPRPARRRNTLPVQRRIAGWALAVGAPLLLTLALVPLRDDLQLGSVLLLFLSVAVGVAAVGGAGPGVVSALVGFLLVNWFFTPPIHTFTVGEAEHLLALVVFLAVAATVSAYVALAARRATEANRARAEATTLARLAAGDDADPERLAHLLEHLREAFRVRGATVLGRDESGASWVPLATRGIGAPLRPQDADASFDVPVDDGQAVLLLAGGIEASDRAVLAAFANRLGDVLDLRRMAATVEEAEELLRGDDLRTAILAAVSHDLRSPLAAIKASTTSLLADDVEWPPDVAREFLEAIDAETDRLTALVANLLDMSRISADAVHVQLTEVGVDELAPAAVASLGDRVGPDDVDIDVPETLPRVCTDPVLVERVLANLVANALTVSPSGTPVRVDAGAVPGAVVVRVVDRGPGIPAADRERVFQPFQRLGDAASSEGPGIGLGLAVARGFARAVGADLALEDTPGGGTTMVLTLPLSDAKPVAT